MYQPIIPWGEIPASPFPGVAAEQERQIQRDVLDFIAEQWQSKSHQIPYNPG